MTKEELSKRLELASKYGEIKVTCEVKLKKFIESYEAKGYYRKVYNFSSGTPLGYAFLKKDSDFNPEIFYPGQGRNRNYYFLDINGTISESYKNFGLLLNETKNRGSIEPFDWTKEELDIILKCGPITNAKSRKIPVTAKDSDIIIGYHTYKK